MANAYTPWSPEEDDILVAHMGQPFEAVLAALPGRTFRGIKTREALILELRGMKRIPRVKPRPEKPNQAPAFVVWSDAEIQILESNRHVHASNLTRLLPGRTVNSIRGKRAETGLTYEPLTPSDEPARKPGDRFVSASGIPAFVDRHGTPLPRLMSM